DSSSVWNWQRSSWLPALVDHYFETVSAARVSFAKSGLDTHARSLIDIHDLPDNAAAVIAYAPRALTIALFAPFPSNWMNISPVRVVSAFEMLIWYLIAPGILLAFMHRRSSRLLIAMIFALSFLYIYGFTIPNVG